MKQYASPEAYEAKLEKVMTRLNVDSFDYDWSRFECWVSFKYKGQYLKRRAKKEQKNDIQGVFAYKG